MSRKAAYIEAGADHSELEPLADKEEELEELDKGDVQEEILSPTSVEITLVGGEKVYLPYSLTISQIFKTKVMNNLRYFYFLLQSELKSIKGDKQVEASDPIAVGILFKPSIQTAMAEVLSTVTKMPVSKFTDTLDDAAIVAVFSYIIKVMTDASKGQSANSKN